MMKNTTMSGTTNNLAEKELTEKEEKKADLLHGLRFLPIPVSALLLAFLLNTFVMMSCIVPSESMETSIEKGTLLIVSRLSYNADDKLPQRGDVIVFRHSELGDDYIIKRVIGLPGENVEIKDGKVYIDGEMLHESYAVMSHDNMEIVTVPENGFFVLGDNRDKSFDSRFWEEPFVFVGDICGKAIFMLYPKIGNIPR